MAKKSHRLLKIRDLKPLKLREVSSPGGLAAEVNRMKRQIELIAAKLDEDAGTVGVDYVQDINDQE